MLGRGAHRELVHVGLAEARPGRPCAGAGRRCVVGRHPAAQDPAAARGRQAPGRHHVLDRDRHAGERREPLARGAGGVDIGGVRQRLLRGRRAGRRGRRRRRARRRPGAVDLGDAVEVRPRRPRRRTPRRRRALRRGRRRVRRVRSSSVGHVSPPRGSAAPGSAARSTCGAPASASAGVRQGAGSSGRVTFVSGIGCEVAGTSSPASSRTAATASRMTSSWPASRSSSSGRSSMRASTARCATSSREMADMALPGRRRGRT